MSFWRILLIDYWQLISQVFILVFLFWRVWNKNFYKMRLLRSMYLFPCVRVLQLGKA